MINYQAGSNETPLASVPESSEIVPPSSRCPLVPILFRAAGAGLVTLLDPPLWNVGNSSHLFVLTNVLTGRQILKPESLKVG